MNLTEMYDKNNLINGFIQDTIGLINLIWKYTTDLRIRIKNNAKTYFHGQPLCAF